jgi:hypothetical protein
MIHYAEVTGTLYFYTQLTGNPYAERRDYEGVCTVLWVSDGVVYLKALRADMDRAMQRELLDWFVSRGIKCVKAERAPGRSLPLARRVGDHDEIDVSELVARFKAAETPRPPPKGPLRRRGEPDWEPTQPGLLP